MNRLILILILTLNLQALVKADDIRDFQIEGISIGDSATDYFTIEKIIDSKQKSQYPNDEYILYNFTKIMDLKKYDLIMVSIKKNDKKYKISSISTGIKYLDLDKCFKLKKDFNNSVSNIFKDLEKDEVKYKAQRDKTGKSMIYGTQYYFPSEGTLTANCMDWSEEMPLKKVFQVSIRTKNYSNFIINRAYK